MKLRDTLIDLAVFILFFGAAAAISFLAGEEGLYRWVAVAFISAFFGTGIFRIALPYSSLSRKERKRRDMLCQSINCGAFSNDITKMRRLRRIMRLYHNGKFRKALIRLDTLSEYAVEDTDKFALGFWTGMCCYYMRLYSDAIDELSECFRLNENAIVASNLGLVYCKTCRYDMARHYYNEALRLDPADLQAIHGLSTVLMHQECYDEATKLCQRGLGIDQEFFQLFEIMSLCYAAKGDREQSYKLQERLAEHDAYAGGKLLKTLDAIFRKDDK